MIVKIIPKDLDFKPITIELTFTSEWEIKAFASLFNHTAIAYSTFDGKPMSDLSEAIYEKLPEYCNNTLLHSFHKAK